MAILKPTTPSTTESATNRIDLDALSAALTAANVRCVVWREYIHVSGLDGIDVFDDGSVYVGTSLVAVAKDVQHALDLIRAHTTPARSPDDACSTAGEEG